MRSSLPPLRGSSPSLPADLREQATGRLRITAITYAAVFFLPTSSGLGDLRRQGNVPQSE
jgi:hypothetical protein